MSSNELAAAAIVIARRRAATRRTFMFLGVGFIILLVVALVVLIVVRRRRAATVVSVPTKEEALKGLVDKKTSLQSNIAAAGSQYGFTDEDVNLITNGDRTCVVFPKDGKCDEAYFDLKDGCCEIRDNSSQAAADAFKSQMKLLALEIGVSIVADIMLTSIIPKIINGKIGGAFAARLRVLLKSGISMGAKFAPKMAAMIAKVASTLAMKMAVRMAGKVLLMMAKLGSGPVGWALIVVDIALFVLESAGRGNYDSWVENKMYLDIRNQIVYAMYEALAKEGMDMPMLFPISDAFPDEFSTVTTELLTDMMGKVFTKLVDTEAGTELVGKLLIQAYNDETDVDEPLTATEQKIHDDAFDAAMAEDTVGRDKTMFTRLLTLIPKESHGYLMLVPALSTKDTFGISMTKLGADKWNKDHREEWIVNNDLFYPPNIPAEDYQQPMVAVYTKTYLTIDSTRPGTRDKPNVVERDLPVEAALAYPFGMLVSHCEKPRTSAKYKTPIDPMAFGVKFNYTNGVCDFTKDYCQRYGLELKKKNIGSTNYIDCVKKPGQAAAEVALSPEIVRANIRTWERRKEGLNSKDPGTVALTVATIMVDPFGHFETYGTMAYDMSQDTQKYRKDKYSPAEQVALNTVDPLGIWEGMGRNFDEKLAGRDKYCVTGDTCIEFHAKHNGGNFMKWSAHDKNGDVYSNGQGYQDQVKDSEDHTFFVPDDGYFRVKCLPGETKDFPYAELTNPFKVSCTMGKVKINRSRGDQATDALAGLAEGGEDVLVDVGNKLTDVFTDPVGSFEQAADPYLGVVDSVIPGFKIPNVPGGSIFGDVLTDPVGSGKNAGEAIVDTGKTIGDVITDPVGSGKTAGETLVETGKTIGNVLNPFKW